MNEPLSGSATTWVPRWNNLCDQRCDAGDKRLGPIQRGNSGWLSGDCISGAGVGGNGALRSVGNDIYMTARPNGGLFRSLNHDGNATIAAAVVGTWVRKACLRHQHRRNNYNLTLQQANYSEWHEVTIDPNLGNIDYILTSPNTWNLDGMEPAAWAIPTTPSRCIRVSP